MCPIQNKPSKNSQRLLKFCQSGEISHKSGHSGCVVWTNERGIEVTHSQATPQKTNKEGDGDTK